MPDCSNFSGSTEIRYSLGNNEFKVQTEEVQLCPFTKTGAFYLYRGNTYKPPSQNWGKKAGSQPTSSILYICQLQGFWPAVCRRGVMLLTVSVHLSASSDQHCTGSAGPAGRQGAWKFRCIALSIYQCLNTSVFACLTIFHWAAMGPKSWLCWYKPITVSLTSVSLYPSTSLELRVRFLSH